MHRRKLIVTVEGVTVTEMIPAAPIQSCDMETMHEETGNTPVHGNWSFAQKMSALGLVGQCQMILRNHIDFLTVRVIYTYIYSIQYRSIKQTATTPQIERKLHTLSTAYYYDIVTNKALSSNRHGLVHQNLLRFHRKPVIIY